MMVFLTIRIQCLSHEGAEKAPNYSQPDDQYGFSQIVRAEQIIGSVDIPVSVSCSETDHSSQSPAVINIPPIAPSMQHRISFSCSSVLIVLPSSQPSRTPFFIPAVTVWAAGGESVLPHKVSLAAGFAHGVVQTAQRPSAMAAPLTVWDFSTLTGE